MYTCTIFLLFPGNISLVVQVDDSSVWFADGFLIGSTPSWDVRRTFSIPASAHILAVEAHNYESGCAIFASLSTGVASDASWKCVAEQPSSDSWKTDADFDDSSWLNAVDRNADYLGVDGPKIWAAERCTPYMFAYCRVKLP